MSVEQLTVWDGFVLATLAISIAFGAFRGFVRTVFALAAWIVAFVGTPLATPSLITYAGWNASPLVIGALVFVALLLAVRLFGSLLARAVSRVGLGVADRTLGSALGVLRALVVITVVAFAARQFGADREAAWQQALSRPLLDVLVSWVDPWLPTQAEPRRPVRTTERGRTCAESWA